MHTCTRAVHPQRGQHQMLDAHMLSLCIQGIPTCRCAHVQHIAAAVVPLPDMVLPAAAAAAAAAACCCCLLLLPAAAAAAACCCCCCQMVEETEGASGVIFAYLVTAVGEPASTYVDCLLLAQAAA
jgi:hypothetical protein